MEIPKVSDTFANSANIEAWENAFNTLDKRVISAEAIGEYKILPVLSKYCQKDDPLLDYGCGKGQTVRQLSQDGYGKIWGIDPSELLLGAASQSDPDRFRVMNGSSIPFPDRSFKTVFCLGVLHHIDWNQLPQVLTEISRVLVPSGSFIAIEPRKSIARSIGHMIVLSDLAARFENFKSLADCLRAEWPTYIPWIKREKTEFIGMCEQVGLRPVERKNHLLTTTIVLKK